MLRNERYRGVQVWNRTEKARNPETGRKVSRARPSSDWIRVEVPEWRIVNDELWKAVQDRIAHVNHALGGARAGGLNRTERSKTYLFSGLLVCGDCGSRIVIISGQGKRGYVRYGCPSHRYRGVCSNGLTIRRDRLEEQLIAAIEKRVLNSHLVEHTVQRFYDELQKRLAEIQRGSSGLDEFRRERRDLQVKAERLADAIAEAGHSPVLLSKLATVESQISAVDRRLEAHAPKDLTATMEELRGFVCKNVMNLQELLRSDGANARTALTRHVRQLVLTPRRTPGGTLYDVSGTFDLAPQATDVMPVVARDGFALSFAIDNQQVPRFHFC
jgi:hypothetical protein